jgi:hypothetical protein
MIRLALLTALFTSLILGQSPVKNVYVGSMACAGRLTAPTKFQSWCYKGSVLVVNTIMDFTDSQVIFDYSDITDPKNIARVVWTVNIFDGLDAVAAYRIVITVGSNPPLEMDGVF